MSPRPISVLLDHFSFVSFDMIKSQKERDMSSALTSAADEIRKKRAVLGDALKTREHDAALSREFADQIERHLIPALRVYELGNLPSDQALKSMASSINDALTAARNVRDSKSSLSNRLSGYAEGLNAAASLVEGIGTALLREAERIETLATSEEPIDAKRELGDRPESLRIKRKASELRKKAAESLDKDNEDE